MTQRKVSESFYGLITHYSRVDVQEKAALFVELLRSANHLVVFTGAGISTSAGIGDYRGISGKWTTEDLQVERYEWPMYLFSNPVF